MTPSDRDKAQASLETGRAIYGRLDQIRGPEDAAADIVDLWGSVEAAMQSMLGGSSLTGQTIVRELRQRGLLSLDQANALASFWDARSRVHDVAYKPTLTDVGYARVGYNQLLDAVNRPQPQQAPAPSAIPSAQTSAPVSQQQQATTAAQSIEMPMYESRTGQAPPTSRSRFPMLLVGGIAAAVVIVGILAYFFFSRPSYDKQMADAVHLMQSGQTELARSAFTRIALENPREAEPHVFLSRLARNDGDMVTARNELITAIKNEPNNPLPQREMGLLLLASNNVDLARSFLVRAVRLAPTDSAAQGYLGCALIKLGRVEEGQRFVFRAGAGAWSSCATSATPGMVRQF